MFNFYFLPFLTFDSLFDFFSKSNGLFKSNGLTFLALCIVNELLSKSI